MKSFVYFLTLVLAFQVMAADQFWPFKKNKFDWEESYGCYRITKFYSPEPKMRPKGAEIRIINLKDSPTRFYDPTTTQPLEGKAIYTTVYHGPLHSFFSYSLLTPNGFGKILKNRKQRFSYAYQSYFLYGPVGDQMLIGYDTKYDLKKGSNSRKIRLKASSRFLNKPDVIGPLTLDVEAEQVQCENACLGSSI